MQHIGTLLQRSVDAGLIPGKNAFLRMIVLTCICRSCSPLDLEFITPSPAGKPIWFVLVSPDFEAPTAEMRAALPLEVCGSSGLRVSTPSQSLTAMPSSHNAMIKVHLAMYALCIALIQNHSLSPVLLHNTSGHSWHPYPKWLLACLVLCPYQRS